MEKNKNMEKEIFIEKLNQQGLNIDNDVKIKIVETEEDFRKFADEVGEDAIFEIARALGIIK